MEVKMWRCYTATTIQSIRVMDDYSQRSFNKVNLVAQREQLWTNSGERTKTLLLIISLLSVVSMCMFYPPPLALFSLLPEFTKMCVENLMQATEVDQRAASLEQPELWNVLSTLFRLLTHERKLFPHLFEILLELFSQSIRSSKAY